MSLWLPLIDRGHDSWQTLHSRSGSTGDLAAKVAGASALRPYHVTTVAVTWGMPNRFRSETLILVVPQQIPETRAAYCEECGSRIAWPPSISRF